MPHLEILYRRAALLTVLATAVSCEGSSVPSAGLPDSAATTRALEPKSAPKPASSDVPDTTPEPSSAAIGDLASLIASRQFPSIKVDDQSLVLLTPGRQEELAVHGALRFLREKKVDVGKFTHAMVREADGNLEATLLEIVGGPRFGGYEFSVTLEKRSLKVLGWRQGQ